MLRHEQRAAKIGSAQIPGHMRSDALKALAFPFRTVRIWHGGAFVRRASRFAPLACWTPSFGQSSQRHCVFTPNSAIVFDWPTQHAGYL